VDRYGFHDEKIPGSGLLGQVLAVIAAKCAKTD
jgi:hypothetical protein